MSRTLVVPRNCFVRIYLLIGLLRVNRAPIIWIFESKPLSPFAPRDERDLSQSSTTRDVSRSLVIHIVGNWGQRTVSLHWYPFCTVINEDHDAYEIETKHM